MPGDTVFVYLAVTHLGGVGTWIAILLLARAGAIGDPAAISSGSGLQTAIALTALVGMGTKAGVMPFHVWLPRAHPIAPAPVSALMSGVMIKAGIYALVRVLVDWLGVLPVWFGVLVLALGALSAVGGVVYALFQHDLKRLLAFHSVENIGIIVLGIGACLILHTRGADLWASFALAAALLHTLNHAVFKALLFLGAGAFERAVGSLELDRLGGLLRRMPWTGGAFLVGAMAIAGLPPLNGFASEWLTLQALLHVPAYGGVGAGTAGAIALAALAATAALAVFCFVKVGGLVLLGPPRARADVSAREAPWPMRSAVVFLALACVVLGLVPGLLFGVLAGLAPWASDAPTTAGLHLPGTGSLPTVGIAIALVGLTGVVRLAARQAGAPRRHRPGPADRSSAGSSTGRARDSPSRCGSCSSRFSVPSARPSVTVEGGVVQSVSYSGRVPHLIDERVYRPIARLSLGGARHARRLQSGSIGTYAAYLIALVRRAARRRAARSRSDERRHLGLRRRAGRRRALARAAPAGARPALEGPPPGTPRPEPAPAVPRAPPAVAQERGRRRGNDGRLPPRAAGRRRRARRAPSCSFRSAGSRRTGGSATTCSRSPGCWRWHASPSPPPPGMSRTASR